MTRFRLILSLLQQVLLLLFPHNSPPQLLVQKLGSIIRVHRPEKRQVLEDYKLLAMLVLAQAVLDLLVAVQLTLLQLAEAIHPNLSRQRQVVMVSKELPLPVLILLPLLLLLPIPTKMAHWMQMSFDDLYKAVFKKTL